MKEQNEEEGIIELEIDNGLKIEPSIEFHSSELKHIVKLRRKIRIIDPASIYKFRHIELSVWSSIIQLVTLLISITLFFALYYYSLPLSFVNLEGVGTISELTIIDKLSNYLPLFIIILASVFLIKNSKVTPISRYRLAMLSNSMNLAIFNNIKLLILPAFIFLGCGITLEHYDAYSDSNIEAIFNGATFDIINSIISFISVLIFCLSFRFCFKELKL